MEELDMILILVLILDIVPWTSVLESGVTNISPATTIMTTSLIHTVLTRTLLISSIVILGTKSLMFLTSDLSPDCELCEQMNCIKDGFE